MEVKALETEAFGYRFRSRLEARWAVFFTMIGIPWLYEYQGFDVRGRWYLPDFYFPTLDIYGEVKPHTLTQEAFGLAVACHALLLDGAPDIKPYSVGEPCGICPLSLYECYCAGHILNRIHLGYTARKHRLWYFAGEDIAECPSESWVYAVEIARGARFEPGDFTDINPLLTMGV